MNIKRIILISTIALFILGTSSICYGEDLFEDGLKNDIKILKDTLFGSPLKITAIMGAFHGVFQSIISSSVKPLMIWGAIVLMVIFIGRIITILFGV